MSRTTVLEETEGYVRILRMNRPKAKNAFNNEMYNELADAIGEAVEQSAVRVLVITGQGDAFSAGQDLNEMTTTTPGGGPIGFERLLDALGACDKPIIAAVNGVALGIGMTMLGHTDLNYFASNARMKCPFTSLGVTPEAASSMLFPRLMGIQRTNEFLFTARWMGADEAVAVGLGIAVVPGTDLMKTVLDKATEIAAMPPRAVQATKALLRASDADVMRAVRDRENASLAARIGSRENLEAISAFFEKRVPNFDGLD